MEVVRKVGEVVDVGLTPLICVDDDIAVAQLGALDDNLAEAPLIAYTPTPAANISVAASPARVAEAVSRIRRLFPEWSILYGGGVRTDNVQEYLGLTGLAGVFVGGASLDPDGFAAMCNQATRFLQGE
jgi:triosephosphate isomerase